MNTTRSVSAGADEDIIARGDSESSEPGHAAGTYMGVAPGSSAPPPAAVPAGKGPLTITWPGFQMRPDGSSRVFVQSTAPIDPQPTAAAGKYLLHLPGARVVESTNRLPLDTRYFNTPITKVTLNVDRTGATLVLDLRADITPSVTSERGSTGYYFTYIELPKGSFVAERPKAVAASNAAAAVPATNGQRLRGPEGVTTHLEGDPARPASRDIDHELPPSVKGNGQRRGGGRLRK